MSNEIPIIDDRRGLIFTINGDSDPVYQVESSSWAHAANRRSPDEIPRKIREKVAELEKNGKSGAFVRFLKGEVGVYVVYEKNIKALPEEADLEISIDPLQRSGGGHALSPYDIVLCSKSGTIRTESGEEIETQEGDYYVLPYKDWGRFCLPVRPSFVETTKEFLLLLDELHGKNFLSMSPDKPSESLPPDVGEPADALTAINCYVLNLSSFKR